MEVLFLLIGIVLVSISVVAQPLFGMGNLVSRQANHAVP